MENKKGVYKRRDFLQDMVKAGTAGLLVGPVLRNLQPASYTVQQIIDLIIAEVPGGKLPETVDTIKSGSGDQVVTGIVTTMFATVRVIEEAARRKANFIIAHEPTFYNHTDDLNWVQDNQVVKEKQNLLEKHQIAIWRFHDYWHRMKPDGILYGVLQKMEWLEYSPKGEPSFRVPEQSVGEIVYQLKTNLGIPHLRVIGNLTTPCSRIALMPGAGGGQKQVDFLVTSEADLLIVGESSEWETPEYIRDARSFGKAVTMIILGHSFSEEPGMEYLVQWLKPKVPEIPISHVASGEAFMWL